MKKVLTIGGATKDIFIVDSQPQMLHLCCYEGRRSFLIFEDGRKVEVESLEYHTGGGATNVAVSFKRLGFEVSTYIKVGYDQEGTYIMQSLQESGIDTSFICVTNNEPTAISFIVPTEQGNRVALVYRGANRTITNSEIPYNAIKDVDAVYVGPLSGQSSDLILPIATAARDAGKLIVINPSSQQLSASNDTLCKALAIIDILVINAYEAHCCMSTLVQHDRELQIKLLSDRDVAQSCGLPDMMRKPLVYRGLCFSLPMLLRELRSRGPAIIIVTNGKDGVYVAADNRILYHPSINVPVVCTIGAGDAFASGFVSWLQHGNSIEDSIRAGIVNSASVIGHIGAKTGLLTREDMEQKLETLPKNLLQEYPLQ